MGWESVAAVLVIAVALAVTGWALTRRLRLGSQVTRMYQGADPGAMALAAGRLGGTMLTPQQVALTIQGRTVWIAEYPDAGAGLVNVMGRQLWRCSISTTVALSLPPLQLDSMQRGRAARPLALRHLAGTDPISALAYRVSVGDPQFAAALVAAGLDPVLRYRFNPPNPGWRLPLQQLQLKPIGPTETQVQLQTMPLLSTRLNEFTLPAMAEAISATLEAIRNVSGLSH